MYVFILPETKLNLRRDDGFLEKINYWQKTDMQIIYTVDYV